MNNNKSYKQQPNNKAGKTSGRYKVRKNIDELAEFLKKELLAYINHELRRGVKLSKIRNTLLLAGHHHTIVDEIIEKLKKANFDFSKVLEEPLENKDVLYRRTYYDIINSLIKYVELQRSKGKSWNKIKNILRRYGHSEDIIDHVLRTVMEKRKHKLLKLIVPITILSWFVIVVIISLSLNESFLLVALGLMATLLSILLISSISHKSYAWITIPIIANLIGFLVLSNFKNFNVINLTIFNLILSYIFCYLILLFMPVKTKTNSFESSSTQESHAESNENNKEKELRHDILSNLEELEKLDKSSKRKTK